MLVSTAEQIRDVRCVSQLRFFMTDIIVFSWWRGHSTLVMNSDVHAVRLQAHGFVMPIAPTSADRVAGASR